MKWEKLLRNSFKFTAFEIFYSKEDQKYYVKIFFFDSLIKISGDVATIERKLDELEGACVKAKAFIHQNEVENQKGGTV